MKNKKKQSKKHASELNKNTQRFNKKNRDTVSIRISEQYRRELMKIKKTEGRTMSYWLDDAVKMYLREYRFIKKENGTHSRKEESAL